MAERLGARHILYQSDGYRGIARASGGKFFSAPLNKGIIVGGFDLIYDCVGNSSTLNDCLRWVKARGKVVLVGAMIPLSTAMISHIEFMVFGAMIVFFLVYAFLFNLAFDRIFGLPLSAQG